MVQTEQPGDSIIERVPQAFRRCFRQLVDDLSLNNLLLKPYSRKRNNAGSLFRTTNSLDVVVIKGRWANQRTARIYVNTALQDIAAHSITSEAESKMSQACNLLRQRKGQVAKSQAWLFSFLFKNPVNWKHSQILNAWMCITYQEQTSCLRAPLPLSTARAGHATLT